jgi:hypothetical protein
MWLKPPQPHQAWQLHKLPEPLPKAVQQQQPAIRLRRR